MVKEESAEVKRVLMVFARHYDFLKLFESTFHEGVSVPPRYTFSRLVDMTGKDVTYLSKLTKKLKNYGLLEVVPDSTDGRRKCYSLSALGFKLLKAVEDVLKPREKEEEKEVEPWKVEGLLKIMEGNWSEELRYKCVSKLFELVDKNPVALLSKCQVLRKRFEDWLTSPPLDDKVGERIRATIYCSIARLVQGESTRDWVLSSLYPKMCELLRHPSSEAKRWAVSMLQDVALYSESPGKRAEVVDLFLSVLLDKEVDLDKEPYNYVVVGLAHIVERLAEDEKKRFLDRLKFIADKGRKQEVERLLDRLILHIF